jgi:hypothetical protein
MCTVSFYKETLNITIHNLHPDLELTSLVYFNIATACYVPPSQQIDSGNAMSASFGIALNQEDFKGALLYKLQRKYATRTDNHPNNNSTVCIENPETNVYLLVVWNTEAVASFCTCLIECADDFTWDEDKLWALYAEYKYRFNEFCNSDTATWSMHDGAVMKTKFDVTYGSECKLNIVISKSTGKYKMKRPKRADPKRLVLSLTVLMVLIYAASLSIEPSIKLNTHNQCLDIDLVSPTYFIYCDLKCYKSPDYKVYAGDTTRSGFIIKSPDMHNGVLIYGLQREQSHKYTEIGEDTSITVYLLVVWDISKSEGLCANVLLIEYDKGFD